MGKVRQKLIGGMNAVEREVFQSNTYLERIPSQQKPREIEVRVPIRLNPDFKIFYPPLNGIWVEVKGHLASANWFPALKEFPLWMRKRYKIVVVETNTKKRNQMVEKLQYLGYDYHIHHKGRGYLDNPLLPAEWLKYALELYTNDSTDEDEVEDYVDERKAKVVVDRHTRPEDSIVCG